MIRYFKLYPDGKPCSIRKLEKKLGFRYLSQNIFEQKSEVYLLGIKAKVGMGQRELGDRYIEQIREAYIPDVSIRNLGGGVGYGLFAEEGVACGDYVGEYTGLVRKNDRRYCSPVNNYCYEYPVLDQLGRNYVIDATQGNLTRFINHSYQPNLKPVYAYCEGYFHLIFLSLRDIQQGEQLCYDYGREYWYVRQPPEPLS